jgi:hypothetical protein
MTSFVHTQFPTEHPGVARAQAIAAAVQGLGRKIDAPKSMATLLMAALVAALVVVANQVITSWAEGHLLLAWTLLWAFAFAALAFIAPAFKRSVRNAVAAYDGWGKRVAQARADAQYWESAQHDPRIMADLKAAQMRTQARVTLKGLAHNG